MRFRNLLSRLRVPQSAGGEVGAAALVILVGFMVMGVPLSIAATQMADQLVRTSSVYDKRLEGMYSAGAGVEAAIWELLDDPGFGDGLTPADPSTTIQVDSDGVIVMVTVTKIFSGSQIEGQGLVVTKDATPTIAQPDTPTTFTYTITVRNEGTDGMDIEKVFDYLPPGFAYVSGSTSGDITTSNPNIDTDPPAGDDWYFLSPNPPKDTDGRREDSGRGWVRELQGRWPGALG